MYPFLFLRRDLKSIDLLFSSVCSGVIMVPYHKGPYDPPFTKHLDQVPDPARAGLLFQCSWTTTQQAPEDPDPQGDVTEGVASSLEETAADYHPIQLFLTPGPAVHHVCWRAKAFRAHSFRGNHWFLPAIYVYV